MSHVVEVDEPVGQPPAGIDDRRPILSDNGCPTYLFVLLSRLNSNRWGLPPFMKPIEALS
jgi:hypothetical protein